MIIDSRQVVPIGNKQGIRLNNIMGKAKATVEPSHQMIRIVLVEKEDDDGIEITLSHQEAIELCASLLSQVSNAKG